jgi:hypothetical protein
MIARLERAGWQYSIGVRMQAWVPDAIARSPEGDWRPLEDYPDNGEALRRSVDVRVAIATTGERRMGVTMTSGGAATLRDSKTGPRAQRPADA